MNRLAKVKLKNAFFVIVAIVLLWFGFSSYTKYYAEYLQKSKILSGDLLVSEKKELYDQLISLEESVQSFENDLNKLDSWIGTDVEFNFNSDL